MERASAVAAALSFALLVAVVPTVGAATIPATTDQSTTSVDAGDAGAGDGGVSASDASQSDLVTLTVDVQTDTGEPVGGAEVEVEYEGGSNTTQTFSNGQALVDVPEGADVIVRVTDDRYVINRPVGVANVRDGRTVEVTMYPKSTAVVEVRDDSGAVRDAEVSLRKQGDSEPLDTDTTGDDGVYQLDDVEAGTYEATVVKRGYARKQVSFTLDGDTGGRVVTLEGATVQLSVRVLDDHFRSPQPVGDVEVRVTVGDRSVRTGPTDDSGRVQFTVGANGQYTVRVTKQGYTTAERTTVVGESDRTFEFTVQRTPTLTVRTGADRVVAGENVLAQVKNAYGENVEGAVVERDGEAVGRTDASGEVRVSIPETGEYEVVAGQDGVVSEPAVVEGVRAATTTARTVGTTTTEADPLPGFGAVVALAGVLLAVAVLARRRTAE